MEALYAWLRVSTPGDLVWLAIGLTAQLMFSARFLVQWISSEREKKSVVPVSFWWLSLFGGAMLFVYGLKRGEPVILLGQSFGIIVYARNLWLIYAQPSK